MAALSLASPSKTVPPTPSQTLLLLRNQPDKIILIPRLANSTLYTSYMQPDGVIQVNPEQDKILQTLGVITPIPQPQAAKGAALQGIDNQLFNTLFSTNGFVIVTTADDVDQIYYYEVNPVQGYATPSAAAVGQPAAPVISPPPSKMVNQTTTDSVTVYYASTVTNEQPVINCPRGVIAGKETFVDYVQVKMMLECYACQSGMYFDLIRKVCLPFPHIPNYLNQADQIH